MVSSGKLLEATKSEPLRNRVMLAMSYDAALRREELCSIEIGDIDPAFRLINNYPSRDYQK